MHLAIAVTLSLTPNVQLPGFHRLLHILGTPLVTSSPDLQVRS